MQTFKSEQIIGQLEPHKGGYFYLIVDAEHVNQYENKRKTRLICNLEDKLTLRCGLNHLGDGNFFIIISGKNMQTLGKQLGDNIRFELSEDPNPLGVDMPEVLEMLLEQDEALKTKFEAFTMGKKRSLIHSISKIKNLDKQVEKTIEIFHNPDLLRPKKREL